MQQPQLQLKTNTLSLFSLAAPSHPSPPPNILMHTHTHVHAPSFFTWTNSSRTFLFFCLQSPPIATRSFMSPVGGGGNVREAHFSPTGADRSTPPNEKGKGVIVKHVSLQCQNTKQAQWLHPPSFASDVWKGIHPLIYGSWDKHPWTVLVC